MARLELASWESDGNRHVSLTRLAPRPHHRAIAVAATRYVRRGSSVLDFGCGVGQLAGELVDRCPAIDLTVADPYQSCLDATLERVPTATAVMVAEDEVDTTAFGRRFDLVVLSHVLEHTQSPVSALCAVLEVVEPGGHCIVATPNPARPGVLWEGVRRRRYSNRGHVVAWDPSHWRNFLENVAGVEVVEYLGDEVQILPKWLVNRIGVARKLQRALVRVLPWWSFSNIAVVRRPVGDV